MKQRLIMTHLFSHWKGEGFVKVVAEVMEEKDWMFLPPLGKLRQVPSWSEHLQYPQILHQTKSRGPWHLHECWAVVFRVVASTRRGYLIVFSSPKRVEMLESMGTVLKSTPLSSQLCLLYRTFLHTHEIPEVNHTQMSLD